MNVGIIIYSQTGNTLSVAERLRDKLVSAGHQAHIAPIELQGESAAGPPAVELASVPDPGAYDVVVLASYVEAFSLCRAMQQALSEMGSLQGKRVMGLVTQAFPYRWMGGNRALKQMAKAARAKGGEIEASAVVNWMNKKREQQIVEAVESLSGAL